jgi:DivIVA domain-containing protein
MDVTPQVLHDVEFREAKRGYHTGDVDDFLEKLAVGVEQLQARLNETRQRLEAAETRAAAADVRAQEADRRAVERSDVDETLKRTLVLAQRTADAAIKEAEDQAARTLSSAQEQANRLLAEAQSAVADARARAETEARRAEEEVRERIRAEVRSLESVREQLQTDIGAFESHLEVQRSQVQRSVESLQRLLEDPSALRSTPAPEASPVEVPEPEPADASDASEAQDDAGGGPRRPLVAPPPPEAQGEPSGPAEAGAGGDEAPAEAAAPGPRGGSSWRPSPVDEGPPTEAVDMLAERDAGDDEYLAELRKAMTDESPLGPRDDEGGSGELFDPEEDRSGRSRFGRKR